jgi:hypothetical protein
MNTKLFLSTIAGGLAASALLAAPANAAIVFTFFAGPAHSPSGGFSVIDTFDTTAGLTGANFQIKTPPSDPNGAPPANSSPAGTPYLSVLGGGSATYTFGPDVHAFEFDWGSVDAYNTLTINSTGGPAIVVPGLSFPNAADGNQTAAGTNGLFLVVGHAGETFTSVTFASTQNSFEVDNLATPTSVTSFGLPEPTTWGMMIMGFGMAGGMMRARRRAAATA